MATRTIATDPAILKAAQRKADRRRITLDQLIAGSLSTIASPSPTHEDHEAPIRLLNEGSLGVIDRPPTREEIYAERTWPRS